MGSYKKVIDILTRAKEDVTATLTHPDDEHHRLKIESAIQKNIEYLALLTQTVSPETEKPPSPGPATTIAGQKIPERQNVKRSDLEPGEAKVQLLRAQVEELYTQFLQIESLELLKQYDDNLIRGVAKKAKMKVTKEEPEEITLDFIEEIKENIRKQAQRGEDMLELKNKSATTTEEEGEDTTNVRENIVDNDNEDADEKEEPQQRGRRNR